ncbi:MAG TPA: AAA family ATPase, partial [Saprospiraceae bacterium]|nr:AAA family ATPase [Saprospiraceae bacterium]HMQ85929.1 AAA family ATPase [Saprospiraceae bacterium]
MKILPIGRQNFEAIIQEDLLYVDKTRQVYELLRQGRLYFLSRPRRFGKSLLVSLLRHLFLGKRELFKDLWIGQHSDYDFPAYPVLQFNFADFGLKTRKLEEELSGVLQAYADDYSVAMEMTSIATQFKTLVQNIAEKAGRPVVLLIDEYDKPIIDFLTEIEKAEANQRVLRQFFGPLKGLEAEGHLRFLFITGVSKFSKVSLFSDLNNLTDLSIHTLSSDLLGITQEELLFNFQAHIEATAAKFNMAEGELLKQIKIWYNGYSFDGETRLYNPFSLLSFFLNRELSNYWFATGTPTFLVETIRDKGISPQEFEEVKVSEAFLEKFSLSDIHMTGLLFQTGYLTIREVIYRGMIRTFVLGYPNEEVRHSMMHNLVEAFTFRSASVVSNALIHMQEGLEQGDFTLFMNHLKVILSDLKYNWQPPKQYKTEAELLQMWEGYFHAIMYLITAYMDIFVQAELAHHKGRLDLIVTTEHYIYIMEFKM